MKCCNKAKFVVLHKVNEEVRHIISCDLSADVNRGWCWIVRWIDHVFWIETMVIDQVVEVAVKVSSTKFGRQILAGNLLAW